MLGAMGVDAAKREAMADGVLSTLDSQGVGSIGFDDFSRIWDDSAAAKASPVPESPTPTPARSPSALWQRGRAAATAAAQQPAGGGTPVLAAAEASARWRRAGAAQRSEVTVNLIRLVFMFMIP